MQRNIRHTVVGLVAVVALVCGLFVYQFVHDSPKLDISQFSGTVLDTPRDVQPFSLVGGDQQIFNNESLKNQWTMMFFGFTHCGYLCPTTMAQLASMRNILESQQATIMPKVVMISVDPERDDLKTLDTFVTRFNPNFYGARGDGPAIAKMSHEFGIVYTKTTALSGDNIDHSGTLLLFNPQGKLLAFFSPPYEPEQLAKDFQLLSTFKGFAKS